MQQDDEVKGKKTIATCQSHICKRRHPTSLSLQRRSRLGGPRRRSVAVHAARSASACHQTGRGEPTSGETTATSTTTAGERASAAAILGVARLFVGGLLQFGYAIVEGLIPRSGSVTKS